MYPAQLTISFQCDIYAITTIIHNLFASKLMSIIIQYHKYLAGVIIINYKTVVRNYYLMSHLQN